MIRVGKIEFLAQELQLKICNDTEDLSDLEILNYMVMLMNYSVQSINQMVGKDQVNLMVEKELDGTNDAYRQKITSEH